jgi:hypothetical protein
MRHICTFIPAATLTAAPVLGTTARTPAARQRHASRFAGAAATYSRPILDAAAEPVSRQSGSSPQQRA